MPGDGCSRGGHRPERVRGLLAQQLERDRGQPGEQQQLQGVRAAQRGEVDGDALLRQPGPVRRQAGLPARTELAHVPAAQLHLADEQLAEVEAQGQRGEETEVDEREAVPVGPHQQVVRARVAVAGQDRHRHQLGGDRVHPGRRFFQPRPQVAEGRPDERVLPQAVVGEGGQHLEAEPALDVPGDVPLVPTDPGHGADLRAAGQPAEQASSALVPVPVPGDLDGRHHLEPDGVGKVVDGVHAEGAGHREAVGQAAAEVGPVDRTLGAPRHLLRRPRAHLGGQVGEERRARPLMDVLHEQREVALVAVDRGHAAHPPAATGGDRGQVVVDRLGVGGDHRDSGVTGVVQGGEHGGERGVVDVGGAEGGAVVHGVLRGIDRSRAMQITQG